MSFRNSSVRLLSAAAILLCGGLHAQVPGTNVNMVSGTQWPTGDPFLQRQNEPSMAVSSRNALHLLAGGNDYRTVDIPFPPDDNSETGDAWLGLFKSTDGGRTWHSNLIPGYPQDQSAAGLASPLKAFNVGTDPTVRAGTHGLFYYSGLGFNRGNKAPSGVFVSVFQDQNNKGNGDPIAYLQTALVATGAAGQFNDKPGMAVGIPMPGTPVGAATCTINGTTITTGKVYVAYTDFTGNQANNPHSKIWLSVSSDCGQTWSQKTKLNESNHLSQSPTIAIDPGRAPSTWLGGTWPARTPPTISCTRNRPMAVIHSPAPRPSIHLPPAPLSIRVVPAFNFARSRFRQSRWIPKAASTPRGRSAARAPEETRAS